MQQDVRESEAFPNALPRPPEELEILRRVWLPPRGFRAITAINNTRVGVWYVGTAFVFFLLGGILAVLQYLGRGQLPRSGGSGPAIWRGKHKTLSRW